MHVVMIGPHAFRPKGTVRARALLIGGALVRRGYQVTILIPPYDNPDDSGRAWEQDGVRLENATLRRNSLWSQVTVPLHLARRALALGADVVHVFKPIAYSGLAGMALSAFSRAPLVQDTDDWEGTGGWNDINDYPWLWRRLFDWQERWLPRHAGAVTVASRTLQTQVWGFGVDPERVVYLPNGPEPSLREMAEIPEGRRAEIRTQLGVGDAPLAIYLGHIPQGTDMDLALDALRMVREKEPEARLVIGGIGDGLAGLKAHAQALDLGDGVVFPGWIAPEDAPATLAAADVVVNPYRDTLVNRAKCAGKVVAAMAVGKAVVTSRLGENLSYIEDGRSGLLTEPGDAGDLARGLQSVLSDRAWAAELGRNARGRIWRRFDWDARVEDVENAYAMARSGR